MKAFFRSVVVPNSDPRQIITALVLVGFGGVEIRIRQPGSDFNKRQGVENVHNTVDPITNGLFGCM